jgi:hypothetical protein
MPGSFFLIPAEGLFTKKAGLPQILQMVIYFN